MHNCQIGNANHYPRQSSDKWGQFSCHSKFQAPARKTGEQSGNEGVEDVLRFHAPTLADRPGSVK